MDRFPPDDDILEQLPTAHAVGLRLHRTGADPEVIAVALGIDVSAVRGVIDLAERKLASLRAASALRTTPD